MRYVLLGCLVAAALPACAYNETVSAISYNPSRMGAYTKLKIVDSAVLKGGLEMKKNETDGTAGELIFQSQSGITLRDENDRCPEAECSWTAINTITNIKPEKYDGTTTKCTAGSKCNTYLEATSVMIQGESATPVASFTYTQTTLPSTGLLPTLDIYGGKMELEQDSYIRYIPNSGGASDGTVAHLQMAAKDVELSNNLWVKKTLKLGNVTINPMNSQTSYAFVERVTTENQKAYVLAVKP